MTTRETEAVREDHAHLREHVDHIRLAARELPTLSPEDRQELVARILDFLRNTLVPHADEEERTLYPEVAKLLGGHPEATGPMTHDHIAIRARTMELSTVEATDVDRLQELLYGLYALISVHFWKEELLYLPLIERPVVPAFEG
jgi:iron-sulfur cluster repair protein YtfE (RIC family)